MESETKEGILNLNFERKGIYMNLMSASIDEDILVTTARIESNGYGLRWFGETRDYIEDGLEYLCYHRANLHEVLDQLSNSKDKTYSKYWRYIKGNKDENMKLGSINCSIYDGDNFLSTTSIFTLSKEELNKIPTPLNFNGSGIFIHHARPDEEFIKNWDLYIGSNSNENPHLHWKTHLEYFESVKRVPQIARAVYKSKSLEEWIVNQDDYTTIHLPSKPEKMTVSLLTALLGGEKRVEMLKEITCMRTPDFMDKLLEMNFDFRKNLNQISIKMDKNNPKIIFDKYEGHGPSDSFYQPSRWLFVKKQNDLEEIKMPSYSNLLNIKDQLYFRSLFGRDGADAIFEVLKKYERNETKNGK